MLEKLFKGFLALFGTICCLIACLHLVLGPASIPGSIPVNATMDSEDRFYATLFLGFGAAMLWAAQAPVKRKAVILALMGVFFLGGIARIVSWILVGPPISLFIFLGSLELIIPPLVWLGLKRLEAGGPASSARG